MGLPSQLTSLLSLVGCHCLLRRMVSLLFSFSVVSTLCASTDCSMPGFPILHHLLEATQIHVHWVSDAIQPSYPLLPTSPFAFGLSQHSGSFSMSRLFISGGQSIGASASALALPMNIWVEFLWNWLVWPSYCPRDSQESFPAPQFKSINS